MAMFVCYTIGVAFVQFYAIPNKVHLHPFASIFAWFLVVYSAIYAMIGLGAKKTFVIAVAMTFFTSLGNFAITSSNPENAQVHRG